MRLPAGKICDVYRTDPVLLELLPQIFQKARLQKVLTEPANVFAGPVGDCPVASVITIVPHFPGLSINDRLASSPGKKAPAQRTADQAGEIIDPPGRRALDIAPADGLETEPAFFRKIGGTVRNSPVGPLVEFAGKHGA